MEEKVYTGKKVDCETLFANLFIHTLYISTKLFQRFILESIVHFRFVRNNTTLLSSKIRAYSLRFLFRIEVNCKLKSFFLDTNSFSLLPFNKQREKKDRPN